MRSIARSFGLIALGTLVLGGCGEPENYPAPMGVDATAPGRILSDAGFIDVASDTPGGTDGGVDGSSGEDVPTRQFSMNVAILAPTAGDVIPALQKFVPEVEITVDTTEALAEDALEKVSAELVALPTLEPVASLTMNQISLRTIPETNLVIYRFAETPMDVATVPSGNYELVVTALTKGGTEAMGSVVIRVDGGPAIRIDSPVHDKAYKGSAPIAVSISDPFFGPPKDISMKVGQTSVTFTGPGGPLGDQYTANLDFNAFIPALEGTQILTVRAKNQNGTESVLTRRFISDSAGPSITGAEPQDGELIGNVITITAKVEDPAGVLASSVVAVFANGPGTEYTIPLQAPPAGNTDSVYSAVFDTRLLPFGENALFPTLSFRASDTLGNESLVTNVLWLDNRPPVAELDPPELRVLSKVDGVYRCSWPFDPVGADVADDADLVPQITTLRAQIEDQGNSPLTGDPNFVPIGGVTVAHLLVLDDVSQPLVVNTNPVAVGNKPADDTCDAINPLLVPTTRPMTAQDALLITLTPINPAGAGNFTNEAALSDDVLLIGDDRTPGGQDAFCWGGGKPTPPDAICEVTSSSWKSKSAYYSIDTGGGTSQIFSFFVPSEMSTYIGYAGGGTTTKLPSIWTLPKQQSGATNPLCGGTQFDALANFTNDGWACLAVFSTDSLGNKQVSRPLRLCIDKDGDGQECPHRRVAHVYDGTPMTVETLADHGYVTGDTVKLSGISMKVDLNRTWTITVVDAKRFTLDGSVAQPQLARGAPFGDWIFGGSSDPFAPGHVVNMAQVPSCTGTQVASDPMPMVDGSKSCQPWRTYPKGGLRLQ